MVVYVLLFSSAFISISRLVASSAAASAPFVSRSCLTSILLRKVLASALDDGDIKLCCVAVDSCWACYTQVCPASRAVGVYQCPVRQALGYDRLSTMQVPSLTRVRWWCVTHLTSSWRCTRIPVSAAQTCSCPSVVSAVHRVHRCLFATSVRTCRPHSMTVPDSLVVVSRGTESIHSRPNKDLLSCKAVHICTSMYDTSIDPCDAINHPNMPFCRQ